VACAREAWWRSWRPRSRGPARAVMFGPERAIAQLVEQPANGSRGQRFESDWLPLSKSLQLTATSRFLSPALCDRANSLGFLQAQRWASGVASSKGCSGPPSPGAWAPGFPDSRRRGPRIKRRDREVPARITEIGHHERTATVHYEASRRGVWWAGPSGGFQGQGRAQAAPEEHVLVAGFHLQSAEAQEQCCKARDRWTKGPPAQ